MPDLGGGYQMNAQLAQGAADQQQSAGKVSAADAKYVDTAGSCATCSHFVADGQPCQVIVEPVSAGGWCSLFEEGQASAPPQAAAPQSPAPAGAPAK
jgi:hypothetical protein